MAVKRLCLQREQRQSSYEYIKNHRTRRTKKRLPHSPLCEFHQKFSGKTTRQNHSYPFVSWNREDWKNESTRAFRTNKKVVAHWVLGWSTCFGLTHPNPRSNSSGKKQRALCWLSSIKNKQKSYRGGNQPHGHPYFNAGFPQKNVPRAVQQTAEIGFKRSGFNPNGKSPSLQRENQTKRNGHFS